MSFQQGLSGLNAAARNLDVIGNNVANSNTVGAKASRAEFADIYATSLYGAGAQFNGIGVTVSGVTQQFTQGDIATTNNALDMAINGRGFFRMSDAGEVTYTRNGQFQLDREGYLVNAQGGRLTGYPADADGRVMAGVPVELRLQTGDVAPKVTKTGSLTANLDARAEAPTNAFSVNDGSSYNGATSIAVYDSQGAEHTVAVYFRKTAANTWDVHTAADGTLGGPTSFSFDPSGKLSAIPATLTVNVPDSTGAAATFPVTIDLSKMSQFGSSFSVSELTQDGFAAGRLSGFSIASDGTVVSRYTNGKTLAQGRVVLVNFTNPQGLQPLGGNQWAETADSGSPMAGTPGAGSLGVIQSGAVEQSNVDLTAELVNMITAQRVYQANAQTIRTQDQVMQTIVNLR
ncbi:MAG: flagellar hook protein FlgE [Burkholderiaceae bacterium]|jgi:flagellar hook protein FlgE|nr:flagellar hook protein FlgE [Burkholderiaceae bacterium]